MSTIELGRGKFIRLIDADGWEYCERVVGSGVAIIVPVFEKSIVVISQFRHSLGKKVIELPAGLVGDIPGAEKEDLLEGAARELEEETGFRAEKLTFLMQGPTSSGLTNETVNFYLATGLVKVGPGGGDSTENIQVYVVPVEQFDPWIAERTNEGYAVDPKIFAGVYFAERELNR